MMVISIVSPTIGNDLGDISSNGFNNGDVQTAMHGEIYFNTYGGVDGQCNDYYDCFTGDCGM
ncbi:hypothetical protein HG536_0A00330 [Torulaspora globosa]|uniref:Uncharacterized protein n=1 Tax=Torulaspora globosa TaxID=48254 RepID=A0A7G3Z9N0_9SACH|nr:uncharacterized protein HG536_0A00330 [Torulaspora globosa]QLL30216.1 hypothetical protein HG536_0A00330 [Torulaspora globosa]